MNYDNITDAGWKIAQKNERVRSGRQPREHVASFTARLLTVLAVVLAVAWAGLVAVPAFSGLLAAAVVGYVLVWLVPWLVVTSVVRVLETAD